MFQNEKSEEQKAWEKEEAEKIASNLPGQLAVIARKSPSDAHRMERMHLNARKWAARANIPEEYIWEKLENSTDMEALNNLRASKDKTGIAYIGEFDGGTSIPERFQRMAGCLIRNNEDGVTSSLIMFVSSAKDGDVPEFPFLFLPDFFTPEDSSGNIAKWKKSILFQALMHRHLKRRNTIVWVRSGEDLTEEYGAAFTKHLMDNFIIVSDVVDEEPEGGEEEEL